MKKDGRQPSFFIFGYCYENGQPQLAAAIVLIAQLENGWKQAFPQQPLHSFFLDDFFDEQYCADRRFGRVFGSFAALALLIALAMIGLQSLRAALGNPVQALRDQKKFLKFFRFTVTI